MMKRLLTPALWLLAGCAFAAPHEVSTNSVQLHGQRFSVELATDDASRERGLMMRTQLAADHSMLFVFADTDQRSFWMKNTLIPLDILFFDADRKLVSMQLNALPCKADPCATYPSEKPARYVLELAAGTAGRLGVRAGDELKVEGAIGAVH